MKCAGVSVHSLANQLQWTCHGSNSYLTCSLHLFPFFFSPGWPQCFSEPNAGGTSFQWLPGDFKCLSNKEQSRRQREEKGPATIPRPSFTNYAEYLLTGGLSLCLLSHLTPLIFPPFNIPSLSTLLCCSLPHAVERKLLAPPGKRRRQKKRRIKRIRRKMGESLAQALISETFQSDKTDDEKVIRVKVRSWASYLLLSCRTSSIGIFWGPVRALLWLPKWKRLSKIV